MNQEGAMSTRDAAISENQSSEDARPVWTLILTSVGFFMVALDTLVVVTSLPAIKREFGSGMATLEWTLNAFALTYAAGIITAAALGDRSGRRRIFVFGLLLFTASSAACALARSAELLIVGRAIQGIGAAMVMPLSLTLLTTAFPPERRGTVVGAWGGLGGLAVASGPPLGGFITEQLNWHWVFWINVPIGLMAALLSALRLSESRGSSARIDILGVTLISASALALVGGLVRASETGFSDRLTIGGLVIGAAALLAFLAWEGRVPAPMIPLRLFRSRSFSAANATGFLMTGALAASAFLMAQYLQITLHYSPAATGVRLLPWAATPLLVAPLAGRLSDRLGRRPILVLGTLLQGIGLIWFAGVATTQVPYAALVPPLLVSGLGISMAIPVAPTAVLNAVAAHDMGKASGVFNTMQRLGSAFAIALASAVFGAFGHFGSPATFVSGFRPALVVAGGLSLLGALAALAVEGRPSP